MNSTPRTEAGWSSRATRVCRAWRAGLRAALDLALPPLCPSCRELLADGALCAACWSKLSFIAPPFCVRLGIPFAYDSGQGLLSMEAIANPLPTIERGLRCATTMSPAPWCTH